MTTAPEHKTLIEEFISYARYRSKISQATEYAWDFDKQFSTREDIYYFLSVVKSCPKHNIENKNEWEDLMDWFEDINM